MASPTIDERLLYPDATPDIAEDLNRILALLDAAEEGLDALTERVAALEEPEAEPTPYEPTPDPEEDPTE